MKKGFTLAETLITLGIISIIAALSMPALNKTRPDANKMKYLKTYDSLCEAIKALASNPKEYPRMGQDSSGSSTYYDMSKYPFLNIHTSINTDEEQSISSTKSYNGGTKLCKLLAWSFNAESNENCSDTVLDKDPSNPGANYFVTSFTANNGVDFSVRPRVTTVIGQNNSAFGMNVIVDINGAAAPNCLYSANCTRPDRFWFFVTAEGGVVPADTMGQYFINTRKSPKLEKIKAADLPQSIGWNNVSNRTIGALEKVE